MAHCGGLVGRGFPPTELVALRTISAKGASSLRGMAPDYKVDRPGKAVEPGGCCQLPRDLRTSEIGNWRCWCLHCYCYRTHSDARPLAHLDDCRGDPESKDLHPCCSWRLLRCLLQWARTRKDVRQGIRCLGM